MRLFKERSNRKELLDGEGIPFDHIMQNLQELNTINALLGGHRITIKGVGKFVQVASKEELHIAEIGCGGGDNLRAISSWAKAKGINVNLCGVDINAECIKYAQSQPGAAIEYICADYREAAFAQPPDIIFSSLFCHHFSNADLVSMLRWMQQQSTRGFFINDLHRHPIAYYSIRLLTFLFSKSYLVKNDAPLSVLRGFKKVEWKNLLSSAGITQYFLRWQWAFRWLVIYRHDKK